MRSTYNKRPNKIDHSEYESSHDHRCAMGGYRSGFPPEAILGPPPGRPSQMSKFTLDRMNFQKSSAKKIGIGCSDFEK